MSSKTNPGNFFEDFQIGQELIHATPRTVTEGDVALYPALYGPRFAVQSSDALAGGRPAFAVSPRSAHRQGSPTRAMGSCGSSASAFR